MDLHRRLELLRKYDFSRDSDIGSKFEKGLVGSLSSTGMNANAISRRSIGKDDLEWLVGIMEDDCEFLSECFGSVDVEELDDDPAFAILKRVHRIMPMFIKAGYEVAHLCKEKDYVPDDEVIKAAERLSSVYDEVMSIRFPVYAMRLKEVESALLEGRPDDVYSWQAQVLPRASMQDRPGCRSVQRGQLDSKVLTKGRWNDDRTAPIRAGAESSVKVMPLPDWRLSTNRMYH